MNTQILVDVHLILDSYDKVRNRLRRAEDESDLQTAASDDQEHAPKKRENAVR